MLAEHFVGNMENGAAADFTSGVTRLGEWDKQASWDWDNVVMLSNHVHRKPWGEAEPLLVSNLPKSSTNSSASASAPDMKLVKHEELQGAPDIATVPALNMGTTRSHPDKQQQQVMNQIPETNSQQDFLLGLGGQDSNSNTIINKSTTNNKSNVSKENQHGANHHAGQDAETGLKLGLKRSFTPDAPAAGAGTTTTTTVTTGAGATAGSLNRGNTSTKPPPGNSKRPRGSAHHTPRCQVEGCRTDLSSAKDYHRRHKVCAMHSKSAKVSVNSIEQRFCQQCSRFHVLSEFDEGKRSCRRRLAGHNERRRKPQPDPMQLTTALAPYQAGFMRLTRDDRIFGYGAPLSYLGLDNFQGKFWPRLGTFEDHSLVSSARVPERFFMLFPQRKTTLHQLNGYTGQQFAHHTHQHHHQGSGGSMGQNLTLASNSSSPGGGGGGGGLYSGALGAAATINQTPHGVTAGDSGRALSLLSSQSWASAHGSMDQVLIPDSKRYSSGTTGGSPRGYGSQAAVALEGTGGVQGQGTGGYMGVNNYENNSVLTLLQESEYHHRSSNGGGLSEQQQPQHSRPTIDLMMQMSSQQQQQQPPHGTSISYGSTAIYDPHHL